VALVERLAILIDASSQGATREFRKLGTEAQLTDQKLTKTQAVASKASGAFKVLGVAAGTAAVAGITKFADASIDAASALEEARQKAEVVFGSTFGDVKRFAEDTANALNLSERAAFQYASAFGQQLKATGLAANETAKFSLALTELTADFASFNDLTNEEAFTKISSGLAGETEAVRRYGIDVSAASVEAEAYASGIAKQGAALTNTQKVQARLNIIMRETADVQGDVARTSDTLANKQRDLAASSEDLQAKLGADLAPIKAEVLGVLASLSDGVGALDDVFRNAEGSAGGLYKNLNPLSVLFRVLSGDVGDEFAAAAG
jgi:hypothetical protein